MGNTFFSFSLQKTGHSRRFGRFTHGALSYQDLPPLLGWGLAPPQYQGRDSEQRLHRAAHSPKMGLEAPGVSCERAFVLAAPGAGVLLGS